MKPFLVPLVLALAACAPAQRESAAQEPVEGLPEWELDARYDPSPPHVVRKMLDLAKVGPNDIVYDLGSGDGRIVIEAARRYGARRVGIDIDPLRIAQAKANAEEAGVADRVVFRNEDLFEADFSEATVVTLFLTVAVNLKLRPRLLAELKPGTRVVSYWHPMDDWKPERTILMERGANIYLWTIPPR